MLLLLLLINITVTELLIGENRGMGAVKNILAKDFLGNWMTLYTATVDGTIQVFTEFFFLNCKLLTVFEILISDNSYIM